LQAEIEGPMPSYQRFSINGNDLVLIQPSPKDQEQYEEILTEFIPFASSGEFNTIADYCTVDENFCTGIFFSSSH
jgi:hypothetical protein